MQCQKIASVMDKALAEGYPTAVHLATDAGEIGSLKRVSLLSMPRFSLCLSDRASYWIVKDGAAKKLTLRRGEAIAVAPNAVMEPHPEGRYLALGLVFAPELTRFLFARKKPNQQAVRRHQFLLSHHSPQVMDEESRYFWSAMEKRSECAADDISLRHLLQLIMIKSREMLNGEPTEGGERRASFTWQAARQYVHEHVGRGVGRQEVAEFLRIHPNHVSRLFTQFAGVSFNQYVMNMRLQRARRLLKDPALNISAVAAACGFNEANYFIRCYRQKFGASPGRSRLAV